MNLGGIAPSPTLRRASPQFRAQRQSFALVGGRVGLAVVNDRLSSAHVSQAGWGILPWKDYRRGEAIRDCRALFSPRLLVAQALRVDPQSGKGIVIMCFGSLFPIAFVVSSRIGSSMWRAMERGWKR